MLKDKIRFLRDYLIRHSKIAFPVIVMVAVAVTVAVALGASGERKVEDILPETSSSETEPEPVTDNIPLIKNEDNAINEIIYNYYNAQANGDVVALLSLCDEISALDKLSIREKANYIDHYPVLEIYTKKGYDVGETIAYVYYRMTFVNHEEEFPGFTSHYICTSEDGSLYIKCNNFTDEMNEYFAQVCSQDDVVEFNNRIKAEYDTFIEEHPQLATYPEEVMAQVNLAVGVKWSQMQTDAAGGAQQNPEDDPEYAGDEPAQTSAEETVQYVIASTTVNVRSSDSEQADKLGSVTGGQRLQLLEKRVNGWSKVLYEKKEGYIKTEYLTLEEMADSLETIGIIKAKTTINVRAAGSTSAAKLGILAGGDTAELVAVEGEWCKIKYNGRTAYVKGEYVEKQ